MNRRDLLKPGLAGPAVMWGNGLLGGFHSSAPKLAPADVNGVQLLPGYRSRIVAESGMPPVAGGYSWHAAPDGGACFATRAGSISVPNAVARATGRTERPSKSRGYPSPNN